jgi:hypothetical protein
VISTSITSRKRVGIGTIHQQLNAFAEEGIRLAGNLLLQRQNAFAP